MLSAAGEVTTPGSDPRPRRSGAETAERILDAAEACFAMQGYAGTSLRDVADIVGIRIPSLYNHFPNKESLYAAVLERGIAPLLELLGKAIDDERAADSPELFVREVMGLLRQRPNLPRLVQYELLAGGEHLAPILESWLRPTLAQGLLMLQGSAASRRWRAEELPSLLMAYFNIAVGYFTTAPLVEAATGVDPLSNESLDRQTEFFAELTRALSDDRSADHEPTAASHATSTGATDAETGKQTV